MALLQTIIEKIETFITEHPTFKSTCTTCFQAADANHDGRISGKELVPATQAMFTALQSSLADFQIKVKIPNEQKINELLKEVDGNEDSHLDEAEFADFFERVLKLAAYDAGGNFIKKNLPALVAAAGSAATVYVGQLTGKIPDEFKPYIMAGTPVVAVVIGFVTNRQVKGKTEEEAKSKLFRQDGFKIKSA